MPSDRFGTVQAYRWIPSAGEPIPTAGELFATDPGGTGYLVADVKASRTTGTLRITVVVVDLSDPLLARLPTRPWVWMRADDDVLV